MQKSIRATIKYDTTKDHKDTYGKACKGLIYAYTYAIDTDCFYSEDAIIDYLKEDLSLVAGGGYDYNNIKNVTFKIDYLN